MSFLANAFASAIICQHYFRCVQQSTQFMSTIIEQDMFELSSLCQLLIYVMLSW